MLAKISAKLKTPLYELLEDCQLGHLHECLATIPDP
jgi:hypothetical protein